MFKRHFAVCQVFMDGINQTSKMEMAMQMGRETTPELQGDMTEKVAAMAEKAGGMLAELAGQQISDNGGRVTKTLEEGETDTIAEG